MEATPTAAHKKSGPDGSKDPVVEGVMKMRNNVSSRVCPADQQDSPVTDTELSDCWRTSTSSRESASMRPLPNRNKVCATVFDQEDVLEAMRLDAVDEMAESLEGTGVGGVGCGGTVPPPYAEMSSSFDPQGGAAEEGGNVSAALR